MFPNPSAIQDANIGQVFTIQANEVTKPRFPAQTATLLTSGIQDPHLVDTVVELIEGPKTLIAARDLTDSTLPQISAATDTIIKIATAHQLYTYKMRLYRINSIIGRPGCVTKGQAGEVDLSVLNSLDSLEPCEVGLATTTVSLGAHTLPHGYLRIAVIIERDGAFVTEIWRYFKVSDNYFPLHWHQEPNAEAFTWPFGEDLKVDASKSFFPFMKPSYGTSQENPIAIRYDLVCTGHVYICQTFAQKVPSAPTIFVSKDDILEDVLTNNNVKFQINLTYKLEFMYGVANFSVEVKFRRNGLQVDIVCVRNCGSRYLRDIPIILMATCSNCHDVDPADIKYTWDYKTLRVEGPATKYLVVHNSYNTIVLEVTVEYTKRIQKTGGGHQSVQFKGWAKRRFVPAKTLPNLKVNYTVTVSKEQGEFHAFDFEVKPTTLAPIVQHAAAPVRRYFENRVGDRRLYVCSFANRMSGVVLRPDQKTQRMTGSVGLRTADGTKHSKTIAPLVSPTSWHWRLDSVKGNSTKTALNELEYQVFPYEKLYVEHHT
ncbi:hypothetical protein RRG08_041301 [Elysia crispata]|uniref:Uncharacterized protein n=1 Tax=Elysia crispata TaxID=231223 RepID=A0AAE0ZUE8_9GAST|nr:hypothetical protein RRG08_041301 [Elysia crispata]